ncbi:MAG: isoleucine--tRNA ligase [bacterium]|nr:isoleucine--tRNA ligase [bacterium]
MNFAENENKILKFWEENGIFEKLRAKNKDKEKWSFLDGPITANNPMGVHHVWGRTYKDVFQRYKAMQGYEQRFQNGFDCQGLWVEVEVEKELGFKSKKDIEDYGIDKFVEKCKDRVEKYSKIQTEQSIRLGQWMDWGDWKNGLGNSYYTMSDDNNYAIWSFLKKCYEKELLYKGHDVVPWCPRCGTAISQHEILTEEYKEITHQAVYVKFPAVGKENTFFVAWTTTPWTLPANVALAVNPELTYAKVENQNRPGEFLILLKDKLSCLDGQPGEVTEEFLGKELAGLEYNGIFDNYEAVKKSLGDYRHRVILWDEVTGEDGTGIVHIAPGCGQEDFQLGKKENLPVIDPTDEESRYKQGFGDLSHRYVYQEEARTRIFEYLGGLIASKTPYAHRYPTCWRCKEELIFRLVDEWYISMEKLREPLVKNAKKIKWIPSFGLDRELDWLKNMQDWLISKKRYWGLALPIFECKECGKFEVIGSKEELEKRAVEGWEEFAGHSPHRPWVDQVKIKCSKCGAAVFRIKDVGNPWLDAGIVPFSTLIDPETKKLSYTTDKKYWKDWFPIKFICESFPGQFKNWFYSLLVMSTVLENDNPTETIFGYASVHDEKDEEMHKSKGNAIWFDEAVEKIGADPMRWMYMRQNPAENMRFGYNAAEEIKRKLLTLYNSIEFFHTYVGKESFEADEAGLKAKNILDKWILSRLNSLIEKTTRNLDESNVMQATLGMEDFFINDLSLWYIRRSRKRFQSPASEGEKKEASLILYHVILTFLKLIAPFMPFFSEENYQKLRQEAMPESVHLSDWPKSSEKLIDKNLEEKMAKVREIVTLSLAERAAAGIKVRQPLRQLEIPQEIDEELLDLIKEEVNIKQIVFGKNLKLDTEITPQLKEEGQLREIIRNIQKMRKEAGLKPKDEILVRYSGSENLNKIIDRNKMFILKDAKVRDLSLGEKAKDDFDIEKEISLEEKNLWLAIKKL